MSPPPRASGPSATRQRILDAAVDLFSRRGFHETSMRDLAARVGVEAASLYAHFDGKGAILRALLDAYREEIGKLRLPDAEIERIVAAHGLEAILIGGFEYIRRGVSAPRTERLLRLLFNEMYRNPTVAAFGADTLRATNLRELARIFAVVRRRGKMRALDPALVAVLYNAAVNDHFQELFLSKACGRSPRGLEARTRARLALLAKLLSRPR